MSDLLDEHNKYDLYVAVHYNKCNGRYMYSVVQIWIHPDGRFVLYDMYGERPNQLWLYF